MLFESEKNESFCIFEILDAIILRQWYKVNITQSTLLALLVLLVLLVVKRE